MGVISQGAPSSKPRGGEGGFSRKDPQGANGSSTAARGGCRALAVSEMRAGCASHQLLTAAAVHNAPRPVSTGGFLYVGSQAPISLLTCFQAMEVWVFLHLYPSRFALCNQRGFFF